jgi:hypothetical protein
MAHYSSIYSQMDFALARASWFAPGLPFPPLAMAAPGSAWGWRPVPAFGSDAARLARQQGAAERPAHRRPRAQTTASRFAPPSDHAPAT